MTLKLRSPRTWDFQLPPYGTGWKKKKNTGDTIMAKHQKRPQDLSSKEKQMEVQYACFDDYS